MTIQNMDSAKAGGNPISLHEVEGEPRIKDLDLATRLGFADPRMIRCLITRYSPALAELGVSVIMTETSGSQGGRPSNVHYLNRKQAIFITAKSETADATAITIEIIERFDAYEKSATSAESGDLIISTMRQLIAVREQQIDQGRRIGALEQQVGALPAPATHMTVLAYAKLRDITITLLQAQRLGRRCTAETALAGGMIGSVLDERWGVVGTYPIAVLKSVFEQEGLT
jgi:hypothetical protein